MAHFEVRTRVPSYNGLFSGFFFFFECEWSQCTCAVLVLVLNHVSFAHKVPFSKMNVATVAVVYNAKISMNVKIVM